MTTFVVKAANHMLSPEVDSTTLPTLRLRL
jgi:hypothetical protein